jgi:ubiquinone/menaquinone biosynthesis C-methylase UbiE/uncharacterized protein YbaR (Trm112 family)
MSVPDTSERTPERQSGYNVTGHSYESGAYSSRIARAYHRRRCETLQAAIEKRFSKDQPLRILEVGCGTGMTLDFLAKLPVEHELWGLDFSSTMLGYALEKTEKSANPAKILVGDATEIPFPAGAFDAVYGTRFIHQFHHEFKKRIFAEVKRVSRPGSLIAFECYSRPYNHFRYFTDQRNTYDTKEEYFSHYPTSEEINDLTGGDHEEVSLRFGFGRWVNRILGFGAYCAFNDFAHVPPMTLLRDEYWAFATNSNGTDATSFSHAAASERAGFELLRCTGCKGELERAEGPLRLRCRSCNLDYALVNGIPNMLQREAKPSEQTRV